MALKRSWSFTLFGVLVLAATVFVWGQQPDDVRTIVFLGLAGAALMLFGTPNPIGTLNLKRLPVAVRAAVLGTLALVTAVVVYREWRSPIIRLRLPALGDAYAPDSLTLYVVPGSLFLDSLARPCTLYRRALDSLETAERDAVPRRGADSTSLPSAGGIDLSKYLQPLNPSDVRSYNNNDFMARRDAESRLARSLGQMAREIATETGRVSPTGFSTPLHVPVRSRVLVSYPGFGVYQEVGFDATFRGVQQLRADDLHWVCDIVSR